ncbi:MAG: T9SS type A sorting domain-containing protein [Saprospiraceae bacterium]|nr:T9SS type A sorting domain-containing protein [Saprospiraceae bacterium]
MNKLFHFTHFKNAPLSRTALAFTFIFIFIIQYRVSAQTWVKTSDFTSSVASSIQPILLSDSALVFADNIGVFLYKNDGVVKDSFMLAQTPNVTFKTFGLVQSIDNQGVVVARLQYPTGSFALQTLVLVKTSLNGQAVSNTVINLPTTRYIKPSLVRLDDGYLISDNATGFSAKISESGAVLWASNAGASWASDRNPIVLTNKNILKFGLKSDSAHNRTTVQFVTLSPSNGQIVDSGSIVVPKLGGSFAQVVPTKDTGIVLLRNVKIDYRSREIVASKIDLKRRYLQNQSFSPMKDIFYTTSFQTAIDRFGSIYVAGINSSFDRLDLLNNVFTFAFKPDGTYRDSRFYKNFMRNPQDTVQLSLGNLSVTSNGSLYLGGGATYENFLMRLDSFGVKFPEIKGRIVRDLNLNCQPNADNPPLSNWFVQAFGKSNGQTYYQTSDSLGYFNFGNLPVDSYRITAVTRNALWQNCNQLNLHFDRTRDTSIGTLVVQPLTDCAIMKVDVSVPRLRRCFENTVYVYYQNIGSRLSENTRITVKLDSLLDFLSATYPLSSRNGNLLTFQIGDVPETATGSFQIQVRVKCGDSTRLNQTLCVEARAYPDSLCTPTAPNWSGASIAVTGQCQNDSIYFNIRNIGRGTTVSGIRYVVIEDDIVFMQGITPILPPNAAKLIRLPATGRTYRLIADQEPNHPLSESQSTVAVEGCRRNGQAFTTGFFNQFAESDAAPSIDLECREISGSYDPNDKTGLPTGFDNQHFISKNTDIAYLIRFQNTGTDTAFTVIVRDTLPFQQLDPTTVKVGAASHAYTWQLIDKGVLEFRFDNILLPDSFRNVAASNGFVKFSISQKNNLTEGTKIENKAAIYFDFNAPVITNQTLHTIALNYKIQLRLDVHPLTENAKIKIAPNPFNEWTLIDVSETAPSVSSGIFELFDLNGTSLRREKFDNNRFEFHRKDLPTGIFICKISTSDGRLLGIGKVVVQ